MLVAKAMRETKTNDDLIPIRSYQNSVDAHLAKTFLENQGLIATLQDEHLVNMNWLYSDVLGGVKLIVPASQADRARQLLAEVDKGEREVREDDLLGLPCPDCHSTRTQLQVGNHSRGWRLLFLVLIYLPIPISEQQSWQCLQCGHSWKVNGERNLALQFVSWIIFLVAIVSALVLWFK